MKGSTIMPFGGHIADVAREGIWASLTGGWYYEPANSLFCNTLHLYLWSLLFILPLLFGLSINEGGDVQNYGYVPIKYKSKKSNEDVHEESQNCAQGTRFSGSSFSATRATESNALDMIEMLELDQGALQQSQHSVHFRRSFNGSDERRARNNSIRETNANLVNYNNERKSNRKMEGNTNKAIGCELASLKQRRKRRKRAVYYHSLPSFGPTRRNSLTNADGNKDEENIGISGSASSSFSDSFSANFVHKFANKSHRIAKRSARTAGLVPADSLDLLPKKLSSSQQQNKLGNFSELVKSTKTDFSPNERTSVVYDDSFGQHLQSERRKSEEDLGGLSFVRRINSTNDASELRKAKTEIQDSYRTTSLFTKSGSFGFPEGDEFGVNWRMERDHGLDVVGTDCELKFSALNVGEMGLTKNEGANQLTDGTEQVVFDDGLEQQEPCCSSSLFTNPIAVGEKREIEENVETALKNGLFSVDSNRKKSMDLVQPQKMTEPEDLKRQITKFLEELIAKHPEAMDAIESVRMNRLMQLGDKGTTDDRSAEDELTFSRHSQISNEKSAEESSSQPRHLAVDSMDTSPGAVHAFQDEHGNWLTYWFGSKSSGTAQSLMNVPTLLEMSNCEALSRQNYEPPSKQFAELIRAVARRSNQPNVESSSQERTSISANIKNDIDEKRNLIDESNNDQLYRDQPTVVNVIDTSSNRDVEKGNGLSVSSSSTSFSNEASRYIKPINLLRANALHGVRASAGVGEPSNSREASNIHRRHISTDSSSQLLALMQRFCHVTAGELESVPRMATRAHSRTRSERLAASNVIERLEGVEQLNPSFVDSPFHLLNDLQLGRPLPSGLLLYHSAKTPNLVKLREFTLKLDRLSLAMIFDRNSSIISSIFDVVLALLVGLMAVLVLCRNVYAEISLLFFAFTVAGAQFSLLKSVQPDSASPVHGFNWLVAYSRPIYFVILSSIILALDWATFADKAFVNWHPSWLCLYSNRPFHLTMRDFCANSLLFLPLIFTFGLLPQVNTLCMHLLEQLDMHFFGATSSHSLASSMFSICRSVFSVALLMGVIKTVQLLSQNDVVDSVGFSAFAALSNAIAYLLSRESSNPQFVKLLWDATWHRLTTRPEVGVVAKEKLQQDSSQSTLSGPSPPKQLLSCCILTNNGSTSVTRRNSPNRLKKGTINGQTNSGGEKVANEEEGCSMIGSSAQILVLRAQHNLFSAACRTLIFFGIHRTLMFQTGQPHLESLLAISCVLVSLLNHNVYSQMRAKNPWKLFARPILRSHEYGQFEPTVEAKLTVFEKVHVWIVSVEKNALYPLLIISLISTSGKAWNSHNGHLTTLVLTMCAVRLARTGYAQPNLLLVPLLVTYLLHRDRFGLNLIEEDMAVSFLSAPLFFLFVATIVWSKLKEFLSKAHFILCYIAPWQISWGSAFHAFAQPFSIPHSGLTLAQALLSSILSAPLNPFLGSSFFLMSYIRPVKFWERDYNTNRVDHSKLRLASQSLQLSLAGDLLLGRWACTVKPGDCFILSSNYLNCMVQLVECGNGFVTFQLRGLEFRGTYCHQREMEAISEDWADNNASFFITEILCFLFNNAWALQWLAWEVTVAKYVVDGYSISDNSAVNMLQIHELRRLLVTLYVKCVIFYAIDSPQLSAWLADETILTALDGIHKNSRFVDHDPVFCAANDEDFDINMGGLSRQTDRLHWHLRSCRNIVTPPIKIALGTAAYNRHSNAAESFLFGMDALFKGDMRIAHPGDEWVFADLDILNRVISPAIRMALKLHQDHFAAVVDLDEPAELYELIKDYSGRLFISHEHDPEWRRAILANTPSLLALRHVCDDGQQGDYKIIMLNKRHLDMRVIKLNSECVRAFWAGQQQELIFLRNKNPERGSIQNARQVLRNIINSSADQPIGYPIYVSPLITSFVETHNQLNSVLGPPVTLNWCGRFCRSLFGRICANFGPSGGIHFLIRRLLSPSTASFC
uniref:Pecanex-like protein n=1 Tax=Globodera rostochiensis TaxID=31243 RepID=A0A914HZD5_GLORO